MTWGVARYEIRLQLRSVVFWLGLVLIGLMFYNEMVQEPLTELAQVQAYQANKTGFLSHWQEPEKARVRMEQLLAVGFGGTRWAGQWADRMQIVMLFVTLFVAGFSLERDRLSRGQEVLAAKPVSALAYVMGKWLGALLPLLGVALLTLTGAAATNYYLNSQLGTPWALLPYLKAGGFLLLPTLLYGSSLAVCLSAMLPRAAAAVPLYLTYLILGGIMPGKNGFRLDLSTFIIRTEGRHESLWIDSASLLLWNRLLYLGLTAVLLLLAAWAYDRKVRQGVTR